MSRVRIPSPACSTVRARGRHEPGPVSPVRWDNWRRSQAMPTTSTTGHRVVSREEWLKARTALLAEEKAVTRQRDEMSKRVRDLPWVTVDKPYTFDSPKGKQSLADLFGPHSQLIVY